MTAEIEKTNKEIDWTIPQVVQHRKFALLVLVNGDHSNINLFKGIALNEADNHRLGWGDTFYKDEFVSVEIKFS